MFFQDEDQMNAAPVEGAADAAPAESEDEMSAPAEDASPEAPADGGDQAAV